MCFLIPSTESISVPLYADSRIEEDEVTQIEEICTEEAKIREKRIAALFPEGIPY